MTISALANLLRFFDLILQHPVLQVVRSDKETSHLCTIVIATLPEHTDYVAIESAIPDELKLKLLRGALQDPSIAANRFGFTPFANPSIKEQLPCNDDLVLMTRLHCDCWSTLASAHASSKEVQRWRSIFREMLSHVDRFGLLIHFGTQSDKFLLAGPELRSISDRDCLLQLRHDTFYEITS